jgi:DNA-binding response OmpR family regulator
LYHIPHVDDEPGLLEISKLFLEQSGQFRVDTISSAPSTLTRLSAHTTDGWIRLMMLALETMDAQV